MRLVEVARKEDSAKKTGKFSKYMAYGTKISYLLENVMKSPGKEKKLPSSKVMLKTNYIKVQLEAHKKRKMKAGDSESTSEASQPRAKKKKSAHAVEETSHVSK